MSVQNLYILFNKRLKNTWWKYRDAVTCFSNSEILWGSESKLYICTFFQNKFNDMLLIDEMCGQNILNTSWSIKMISIKEKIMRTTKSW